jgi:hypothetical protein
MHQTYQAHQRTLLFIASAAKHLLVKAADPRKGALLGLVFQDNTHVHVRQVSSALAALKLEPGKQVLDGPEWAFRAEPYPTPDVLDVPLPVDMKLIQFMSPSN